MQQAAAASAILPSQCGSVFPAWLPPGAIFGYFVRVLCVFCSKLSPPSSAPVSTRTAPAPKYAQRPRQNRLSHVPLFLAPAGTRLGTRVFCTKSWAAVRFPPAPGSLYILLIKRLDSTRARELWSRNRVPCVCCRILCPAVCAKSSLDPPTLGPCVSGSLNPS